MSDDAPAASLNGTGSGGSDGLRGAPAAPPLAARPEIVVGAAFAGGLALAILLRRLAR